MSDQIDHPLTLEFLDDVINSDENSSISLLNGPSPRVCLDFYWENYKYWTMAVLQLPYVISMILLGIITVFGNFNKVDDAEGTKTAPDLGQGIEVLIWIACILSYILILYEIVQALIQGVCKYITSLNNILDPLGQICFAVWSTCHLCGIYYQ